MLALVASNVIWFEYTRSIHEAKIVLETQRDNEFSDYRRTLENEKSKLNQELDVIKGEMQEILEQKEEVEKKFDKLRNLVQDLPAGKVSFAGDGMNF